MKCAYLQPQPFDRPICAITGATVDPDCGELLEQLAYDTELCIPRLALRYRQGMLDLKTLGLAEMEAVRMTAERIGDGVGAAAGAGIDVGRMSIEELQELTAQIKAREAGLRAAGRELPRLEGQLDKLRDKREALDDEIESLASRINALREGRVAPTAAPQKKSNNHGGQWTPERRKQHGEIMRANLEKARAKKAALARRQRQVIELILRGESIRRIAEIQGVNVMCIYKQRADAIAKLRALLREVEA